jgi:hypothetical protein
VLRNFVYLCAINSRCNNHSQCFQFSKTLEISLQEALDFDKNILLPRKKKSNATSPKQAEPINILAKVTEGLGSLVVKAERYKELASTSQRTFSMLAFSFYYSAKSLIKMGNPNRAEGKLCS